MEILNAAEAKKRADKYNKEITEKIQIEIFDRIQCAAKAGRYSIMVETIPLSIVENLENMGYEVKFEARGDKEIISWRE